jgi:TonB family protein
MSTHANSLFKEASSIWYDWGTVGALAAAILLFEFAPASEMGKISARESDSEMQAVEADLAFDDTVQQQEEQVQQQQEDMQQAAQDVMQEIQADVTLSMGDSVGLQTVGTVGQTIEDMGAGQDQEMGPPRFMPVEVFPNCTFRPNPQYPSMARAAGVEGTVTLWVFVKADGTVGDVSVYNSSGADALDEAAVSAAWNTRWVPAQNNGQAVGVWTTMQYVFQLTQ